MQIYVCCRHVPDSAASIHILDNGEIDENVAFLLNPYDEHAVTEAVALKQKTGAGDVIAVCLGKAHGEQTLRSALAMGADRGILVEADHSPDSMVTARALAAAIQQDGTADMIFTGKASIDAEGMQTHFRLGALMNLPVVTNAADLVVDGGRARITCELSGGRSRVFEADLPCVVGAGRGLNTPLYPTFPEVVKARKKPIKKIPLDRLAIPEPPGAVRVMALEPLTRNRQSRPVTGTPAQVAQRIIHILRQEAKVL